MSSIVVHVVLLLQIVENLKRRHVPVEYILFPDEGHGFRKEKNRITSTVKMVEFFVAHLIGAQPATVCANWGLRRVEGTSRCIASRAKRAQIVAGTFRGSFPNVSAPTAV